MLHRELPGYLVRGSLEGEVLRQRLGLVVEVGSIIQNVMTGTNVSGVGLGPSIPLDNGR